MAVAAGHRQLGLSPQRSRRGSRIDRRKRAIRPGQGLLDVGLGVAHELVEQRQRVGHDLRSPLGTPLAVGHRGDRGADQAALPARRGVDELFQLGPSIGFGLDPGSVWPGEVVHGDPVGRLPGRPAQELPGPFRIRDQGAFEDREGEPARLELGLAEEPVGDEQERGRPIVTGGATEAANDRGEERSADAVDRAETRSDANLARAIRRVGQTSQAIAQGLRERIGLADALRDRRAERLGGREMGIDEGYGQVRGRAARSGFHRRGHADRSTPPGASSSGVHP